MRSGLPSDKSSEDRQSKTKKITPKFDDKDISQGELINHINGIELTPNLKIILETQELLRKLKEGDIKFSDPVISQNGNPVIYPHTINVIQGQAGVHKSRLAELVCSVLLKTHNCDNELLGFKRTSFEPVHTVVYVDTERNLKEQFPFALQSIQINAGYAKADHPPNFEYISLLQINRKERFAALNQYLNHIKKSKDNPLFMVLDVATDCIEDFNKVDKSMELIDLMNMAINEHNVIFLCLIHENPGSDKARGHFGTELMNKSTTLMQVRFEKDSNNNDTDLIKVKYLKCRSTAKHTPFHMKYSNEAKGLILADSTEVSSMLNSRKHKAPIEDMAEFIEMQLGDGSSLTRVELTDKLCAEFRASARTIADRLNEIMDSKTEFFNTKGEPCKLYKETKEKTVYYKLVIGETA